VLSEQRLAALGSKFLIVSGDLQKADGVTHVIVRKFHDASRMVGSLEAASRDFH
jgi:error-prone DNA polymerase